MWPFGCGKPPKEETDPVPSPPPFTPPVPSKPTLPVIIVPGFMSTGLRVKSSESKQDWRGQRIWINFPKLGFGAAHVKGVFDDVESQSLKNKWLEHLMLKSANEENDGVKLEAIPGVEGVDFLDPDSMFGLLSGPTLVFAPVIAALQKMGYTAGQDLDAASYDWRFAPGALQSHSDYFTQLKEMVEEMVKRNQASRGVVLLAHSMGNKTVPYFLEFAKKHCGQAWLDKHIAMWVALGAPHVGAPAAARATILGDRMGLEAFLTMPEAILMGRSFSSSPWLFPVGPHSKGVFFWRRQGMLEVTNFKAVVPHIGVDSTRNAIKLTVHISWADVDRSSDSLDTKSSQTFDGSTAEFEADSNVMQFGGPAELSDGATINIVVKEKGLKDDRKDGTSASKLATDAIMDGLRVIGEGLRTGKMSLGVPRAVTITSSLRQLLGNQPDSEGNITVQMPLEKLLGSGNSKAPADDRWKSGYVMFKLRWHDADAIRKMAALPGDKVRGVAAHGGKVPVCHRKSANQVYEPVSQMELLKFENCPSSLAVLETWNEYYENDQMYNTTGTNDYPPISRVTAIFGVNVPTEVMFALRIKTVRMKPSSVGTRLMLDDEAALVPSTSALRIKGGIISETGGTNPAGDGTVPYSSLAHCQKWKDHVDLTLVPLHRVEHRPMLSNAVFLDVLEQTLMPKGGFSTKWQSVKDAKDPSQGWSDFPVETMRQLNAACSQGKSKVTVKYWDQEWVVEFQALVQRNTRTGMELPIRQLTVPRSNIVTVLTTRYCARPKSGFSSSIVLADNTTRNNAALAASRAVREDPENTVAVVMYFFTFLGGYWTATKYTSRSSEKMAYKKLYTSIGFVCYADETRSRPP